jgi:hypothetical protein
MTLAEPLLYDRALVRIARSMLALAAIGTVVVWFSGGWRWSAGFLIGALISYLSFRGFQRLVNSLGPAAEAKPPRARVAILMGVRYLLLAAGAYAIVRVSTLSLTAALLGLFVSAAAVILEILYELIYART